MKGELGKHSYCLSVSSSVASCFWGVSQTLHLWEMTPAGVIFIRRAVDVPEAGAPGGKVLLPPRDGL